MEDDDWPEVLRRWQDINELLELVWARRPEWSWQPAVLSITASRYAVEIFFCDRVFTLRIPPDRLSEADSARVLSSRTGFCWSQMGEGGYLSASALCKDYTYADMRAAAEEVIWLMRVLWRVPRTTPMSWHTGMED